MPDHFEMFNRFIRKYVEMTPEELVDLQQKCEKVEFSKGTIIIKANEPQENLFLLQGVLLEILLKQIMVKLKFIIFEPSICK